MTMSQERDAHDEVPSPTQEQRQSVRKSLIVDVEYEGGNTTGMANTENIGLGGLFLRIKEPFAEGTPLKMKFAIGGNPLDVGGSVVFVEEGHGIGVKFVDLTPDEKEVIREEIYKE